YSYEATSEASMKAAAQAFFDTPQLSGNHASDYILQIEPPIRDTRTFIGIRRTDGELYALAQLVRTRTGGWHLDSYMHCAGGK
ncbi:MAG TPA: hypothetical protein VLI04_16085, partial [Nocardioidaceae bacterium]|nr:hypothetical protein [Nocardioidaceae bacterium]